MTARARDGSDEREYGLDDVSVVMGAYDEEEAVGSVLDAIDDATDGAAEVVVVDGSSDATPEIARERGARVVEQEPQGYGVAVERALSEATNPVVVTTDCDDTYPMDRIPDFLERINAGRDVVSGDRISGGADAMPFVNRFGNRLFALLASVLMLRRVHDTTTGMRAYHEDVIDGIEWTENTGLSAELLLRPTMRGYDVVEESIAYGERLGDTTLDPIQGGWAIGLSILRVCLQERLGRAPGT